MRPELPSALDTLQNHIKPNPPLSARGGVVKL